jgi:magnesium-transporting ATPase (P-type)
MPSSNDQNDRPLIPIYVIQTLVLFILVVLTWNTTRKQVYRTLEVSIEDVKQNMYGMFLLMTLSTFKFSLFMMLIVFCATTIWYMLQVIYLDNPSQKLFIFDLETMFGYFGNPLFYGIILGCTALSIFIAFIASWMFYNAHNDQIADDEYFKYAEEFIMWHVHVTSGIYALSVICWFGMMFVKD